MARHDKPSIRIADGRPPVYVVALRTTWGTYLWHGREWTKDPCAAALYYSKEEATDAQIDADCSERPPGCGDRNANTPLIDHAAMHIPPWIDCGPR